MAFELINNFFYVRSQIVQRCYVRKTPFFYQLTGSTSWKLIVEPRKFSHWWYRIYSRQGILTYYEFYLFHHKPQEGFRFEQNSDKLLSENETFVCTLWISWIFLWEEIFRNLIVFIFFFSPMKTQQCKLWSYFEQLLYELANLKNILSQVLKYTLIKKKRAR